MKFRILGGVAAVSAVLVAACVSASEETTVDTAATATSEAPIQVAAASTIPDGYTTNKDGLLITPNEPDKYYKMIDGELREVYDDGWPVPKQKKKLGKAPPPPADAKPPLEVVESAPVGSLHNPYKRELSTMSKWGKKAYLGNSCNGCHGGSGGGGMCPPLSNSTWVYGKDDDTLFRLIALGSEEYMKKYKKTRQGRENVVGPMPPYGAIIKTDDEIWRIISFIRTIYNGDPKADPRNVH